MSQPAFTLSLGNGMSNQDYVTKNGANPPVSGYVASTPDPSTGASPATVSPGASPTSIWTTLAGIAALLALLKWASEHEKADMDPQIIGIGVYNMLAVTLMAGLGIVTLKAIFTKFPVKGVSTIVANF